VRKGRSDSGRRAAGGGTADRRAAVVDRSAGAGRRPGPLGLLGLPVPSVGEIVGFVGRAGSPAGLQGGPRPSDALAPEPARALVEPPVGLGVEEDELARLRRHVPSIRRGCDIFGAPGDPAPTLVGEKSTDGVAASERACGYVAAMSADIASRARDEPASITSLLVRQKVTLAVNRYTIHAADEGGAEGPVLATAEQKRLALKEQVTFYVDEVRTQPVFGFKARSLMDLGATYDVTDATGEPIGWFRKDFRRSLTRSTWHLGVPAQDLEAVGTERNKTVALIRRVWDLVLDDFPCPLRFHFDFHTADGVPVMSSDRRRALRDVYDVRLPPLPGGGRLDWRVAAAMAVALDALQSR
jgi:hypothetical protein